VRCHLVTARHLGQGKDFEVEEKVVGIGIGGKGMNKGWKSFHLHQD